jgi:DNA-binding NarL/FixJ family response regulator
LAKKESQSRSKRGKVIRVAIVEDNPTTRQTFARVLATSPEFLCLGTYPTGEALFESLPSDRPDVVLMDINLPGLNGIECVAPLRAQYPAIQVIMLTVFEDSQRIFGALRAGASGYLLKRIPDEELLQAVRFVHSGGAAMTSIVARKMVEEFNQPLPAGHSSTEVEPLSTREKEVLERLSEGLLVKEIADQLGVGFGTVRTYIRRIYEKLHVRSRSQAAAHFYQHHGRPSHETRPTARE